MIKQTNKLQYHEDTAKMEKINLVAKIKKVQKQQLQDAAPYFITCNQSKRE